MVIDPIPGRRPGLASCRTRAVGPPPFDHLEPHTVNDVQWHAEPLGDLSQLGRDNGSVTASSSPLHCYVVDWDQQSGRYYELIT